MRGRIEKAVFGGTKETRGDKGSWKKKSGVEGGKIDEARSEIERGRERDGV